MVLVGALVPWSRIAEKALFLLLEVTDNAVTDFVIPSTSGTCFQSVLTANEKISRGRVTRLVLVASPGNGCVWIGKKIRDKFKNLKR